MQPAPFLLYVNVVVPKGHLDLAGIHGALYREEPKQNAESSWLSCCPTGASVTQGL